MEETNKPKTKTKPKKSHSEYLIIDIYARNGVIYMVKAHPQRKSSVHPNQFKLYPQKFFLNQIICYSYALFFKMRLITNPWLPLKYINSFLKESKVSLVMERKEKESNYLQAAGLCLNPNRCIYHSLYSCIIGGRGV